MVELFILLFFTVVTFVVLPMVLNHLKIEWVSIHLRKWIMFSFFFYTFFCLWWITKHYPKIMEDMMKWNKEDFLGYIIIGVLGACLFCGYWWFAGKITDEKKQEKPIKDQGHQTNIVPGNSQSTKKSKLKLPPTIYGEVTFDYSSNNGRFNFGKGDLIFYSKWTRADNRRIWCYNDYLRGVAVVPTEADISSLNNVSNLDFTLGLQCPVVGQFVVLKNTKGFFALLLIVSINATTHGDHSDELVFDYWIRPDGGSDFSKERIKPLAF
jgi:hypothetical protein